MADLYNDRAIQAPIINHIKQCWTTTKENLQNWIALDLHTLQDSDIAQIYTGGISRTRRGTSFQPNATYCCYYRRAPQSQEYNSIIVLPFETVDVKKAEEEKQYYNTVQSVIKSCNGELLQFFKDNPCNLPGFNFKHRFTVNNLAVSQTTDKDYDVWYLELEFDQLEFDQSGSSGKKRRTET